MNVTQKEAIKYTARATGNAIVVGTACVVSLMVIVKALKVAGCTPDQVVGIICTAGITWVIGGLIHSVYKSKVRELEWSAGAAQREAEREAQRVKDEEFRAKLREKIF